MPCNLSLFHLSQFCMCVFWEYSKIVDFHEAFSKVLSFTDPTRPPQEPF